MANLKAALMSFWQRLFPDTPDFLGMLVRQMQTAERAVDALLAWFDSPTEANMQACFDIEKEADLLRRDLILALNAAFTTPLDREDMDDTSRRIDDIVDAIRTGVREFGAIKVVPDDKMRDMARQLKVGISEMGNAINSLPKHRTQALEFCSKARHAHRLCERVYCEALSILFDSDDLKRVIRLRECYRQMLHLTEILEASAEQLEHAINKLG